MNLDWLRDVLWPINRVWQNWQCVNSKSRPQEALLVLLEAFYYHVNEPRWENETVCEGKTSCPSRGQSTLKQVKNPVEISRAAYLTKSWPQTHKWPRNKTAVQLAWKLISSFMSLKFCGCLLHSMCWLEISGCVTETFIQEEQER